MKLVAFDYDGVIVDSMASNRHITNGVCGELVPAARLITQDDIENLDHMSFQEVSKVIGVPDEMIVECLKLINKRLVVAYSTLSLFDGISDIVKRIAEDGHIVTIVTHNTEQAVHALMIKNGIDGCFQDILGVEAPGEKGEKLKFLQNRYSIAPENTFMIGDSVGDLREAKLAGAKSIAVSWGFQSLKRLKTCNPDFIAETPEEIYWALSKSVDK